MYRLRQIEGTGHDFTNLGEGENLTPHQPERRKGNGHGKDRLRGGAGGKRRAPTKDSA